MNESMAGQTQSETLQLAIHAAREGGKIVKNGFRNQLDVEVKKKDNSLVTNIDKQAESIIHKILRSGSPHGIIGEEGTRQSAENGTFWIIDPIDGTTNFVRNIPLFCVSIALIQHSRILVGVTYQPMTNACYYAEAGKGAYLNGEKLTVSAAGQDGAGVIMLEHGRDPASKKRNAILFERLGETYTLRKFGTSALELCYVAAGLTDAFISSGDQLWDFAAGIVLVKEAGGIFTDWRGQEWSGDHAYILLSNGTIHNELVNQTRDLQPEVISADDRRRFSYL